MWSHRIRSDVRLCLRCNLMLCLRFCPWSWNLRCKSYPSWIRWSDSMRSIFCSHKACLKSIGLKNSPDSCSLPFRYLAGKLEQWYQTQFASAISSLDCLQKNIVHVVYVRKVRCACGFNHNLTLKQLYPLQFRGPQLRQPQSFWANSSKPVLCLFCVCCCNCRQHQVCYTLCQLCQQNSP